MICRLVFCIALILAPTSGLMAAITVDGDLADWGVAPSTTQKNLLSFAPWYGGNPSSGTAAATHGVVYYDIEDSDNEQYVGPGYGGQDYDAEFLGVMLEGSTLSIAVATGQRSDNAPASFGPGDIRILCDWQTGAIANFGLEVGGSYNTDGDATKVTGGEPGATYGLKSDGHTASAAQASDDQSAGSIWQTDMVADWRAGLFDLPEPFLGNGTQIVGGTKVGDADSFVYSRSNVPGKPANFNQHAFLELSLDMALLGWVPGGQVSVLWAPICGNDITKVLRVSVPTSDAGPHMPEPGSMVVWGLIGLSTVLVRFWRRHA